MHCLTIYLNTGDRKIVFFYTYNEALKYLVEWLIDWFTNYYNIYYDIDDFPFPTDFWYNTEQMIQTTNNILNYIFQEEKDPSSTYPVKYNLQEIKFDD